MKVSALLREIEGAEQDAARIVEEAKREAGLIKRKLLAEEESRRASVRVKIKRVREEALDAARRRAHAEAEKFISKQQELIKELIEKGESKLDEAVNFILERIV